MARHEACFVGSEQKKVLMRVVSTRILLKDFPVGSLS